MHELTKKEAKLFEKLVDPKSVLTDKEMKIVEKLLNENKGDFFVKV